MNATFLKSYNGGILTLSDEERAYTNKECSSCSIYKDVCSKEPGSDKICDTLFETILNTRK